MKSAASAVCIYPQTLDGFLAAYVLMHSMDGKLIDEYYACPFWEKDAREQLCECVMEDKENPDAAPAASGFSVLYLIGCFTTAESTDGILLCKIFRRLCSHFSVVHFVDTSRHMKASLYMLDGIERNLIFATNHEDTLTELTRRVYWDDRFLPDAFYRVAREFATSIDFKEELEKEFAPYNDFEKVKGHFFS